MRALFAVLCAVSAVACAAILGLQEKGRGPFEHRAHVVKGINCLQCHAGVERAGEEGALHLPSDDSCLTCHKKPHDPSPCGRCHGSPALRQAVGAARRHLKFRHPEHVEASQGKCVRCHTGIAAHDGPLRPAMATCFTCHKHQGQWAATDCDGCHVDLEVERSLPESHVVHGPDWLREHGVRAASETELCGACHAERSCAACHGVTTPALPSRLSFDRPERADMHRAGFLSRHGLEARTDPALCVTCHSERSCRACHQREGVLPGGAAGAAFHPPGWVGLPGQPNTHGRAARLDPVSCASCHSGAGEQLCVDCHRVGGPGGNPHPPGFDSPRGRGEAPCRACHGGET